MSCSRIAFIAPAGYGKTQAIVNRVKDTKGKALVLTHTNAGVTALGNRLRLAGVEPACCEVSTIASYCEKWVKAYPEMAGFDELSTFSGNAYYDQLYPAAGQVLSKDWAQHVLSKSYSCVIVDEYQDCTVAQQEALFALSTGLDLVVYGDPMQSIFYWSGNLVSMEDSSFSVRLLDARPYRWINAGAEELGNEIVRIRDALLPTLRGESVSLSLSRGVKGVTFVDAEDAKKFGVSRQLSKYGHDCSCVYLTACEAGEVSFCRRHFGFQVNETIECALLTEWAARLEASVGPERALCLLEFSGVCFTGVASDLKTYMNKLQAGSLDFDRMKKYPELSQLLTDAAQGGGYGCDLAVLDWIERSSAGFRKIRWQLFGEMKRALGFAATHGVRLEDAVAKTHGDMESYESRYRFKHVASRTVLSKGLEFDIAIVDATTVTDPRDFYVAVSRCRLGLIVIANSRTLHFDGISR